MFSNSSQVINFVKEKNIRFIDVRFSDLYGTMQHMTIPTNMLEDTLENGMMFDGSSIKGFTEVHESDMKLIPDPTAAFVDPFRKEPTLVLYSSIVDPFTNEPFSRDPRGVCQKAEAYLKSTGIADTCFLAPEPEFYLFDSIQYRADPHDTFVKIISDEASWTAGDYEEGHNLGDKIPFQQGYAPVSPMDKNADIRDAIVRALQETGFEIERAHHEVGSAGQQEINYTYSTLLHAADNLTVFKYIVKNKAIELGKTVTFMPKPLCGQAGSGMHCHVSLWKDGDPLFYGESGYGGLSDMARWFIGGVLRHAAAILPFTNPSINSYRRLVPGFEAPVNLVYSARNRSACLRIPITGTSPKAKRIEYRVPDPSANPYLAFPAILMAGLDGVRNRIEPADPIDKDLYELPPEEYRDIEKLPPSLDLALKALEEDNEFLTEGDVFTTDLLETWISQKRADEVQQLFIHPHPFEFEMYYNC
ncbi:type I glutamate--ammonia ligase [Mobiluncus porci]|uniref:Glutamine synthetase n=1 Tax=Mobiluncus porci TaxID=2652278 RepID=A0A7K0K4M3_9ACTO|nr:type I glutamate--ammonia ligase [Mobiluncus porci]MST50378.1 type I glutamate--ammonia ligase [Mobiluncus porci]